jgi:hypothetical protein
MGSARVTCPDCGDIELMTGEIMVRFNVDTNEGQYVFGCPKCLGVQVKWCEPRILELLETAGCQVIRWRLPSELFEPKQGPPICDDDLIDFHGELERLEFHARMLVFPREHDEGVS